MKKALFLLIMLFSINFICATPMIPVVFNGSTSYSSNPSMNLQGYQINVSIGSSSYKWSVGEVQSSNFYEIMVDPQGVSGTIYFYIGGVKAQETGTYARGAFIIQDLTINTTPSGSPNPYCGDNSCNNGETCSSCSTDCGSCDDGGDGGGSSGGSSSGGGGGTSSGGTISLTSGGGNSGGGITSGEGITPITGNIVSEGTNLLTSEKLLIALAVMVFVLTIILLIIPKR